MVDDPASYVWSSYQCNALGKVSELHTPHDLYMNLGSDPDSRMKCYRELFEAHVEQSLPLLSDIRQASNKGVVLGNDRFVEELERLNGIRLKEGKPGRPRAEN